MNNSRTSTDCRFSIVIPAFGRLEPLKYTLRSAAAAAARLGAAEIVLVDDGSTPPLEEQLAGFDARWPIRHIRQSNRGSIAARITGLGAAKGRHILFLDSDDLIHPDKLASHAALHAAAQADVVYDDLAIAVLEPDYGARFSPGPVLSPVSDPAELFLRVQPAPHSATYRRDWLVTALEVPWVRASRDMDPSGDVWLYYNLLGQPAVVAKLDAALTATGPHEELRYSQHWEKLGAASLLVAERFQQSCPLIPQTLKAHMLVGVVAFESWRRLPRDFHPDYTDRLLQVSRRAPQAPIAQLSGRKFRLIARLLGRANAGHLLRLKNARYEKCRTLAPAELERLLGAAFAKAK